MSQRVLILIEDDWELQGNGLGNVAHLQYLPMLFLLNLADRLGMKLTFMAEVMQQLKHREYAARDRNIAAQASLWDDCVRTIVEKGHDVQLHLHPQWYEARFEAGVFRVAGSWNIATYSSAARKSMIDAASGYLRQLIRPLNREYEVRSFKAGQWGLQPSSGVLQDLEEAGIRVVMGAGSGIVHRTSEFEVDYRGMEEPVLPYNPDYEDIRKVGTGNLVVLPLPFYTAGPRLLMRQAARRALARSRMRDGLFYISGLSASEAAFSPMGPRHRSRRAMIRQRGDLRSLDIGSASFAELRSAIDQIIRRALASREEIVPVVLQSHTKAYAGNWQELTRFFEYLTVRHERVIRFMTLSEFVQILPELAVVRRHDAS